MKKENQRIAITKRMLRESLLDLLKHRDISKISITELCQAAGINRSTFYRYYTIPQDVLEDIGRQIIEEADRKFPLPARAEQARDYLEQLFGYAYEHADVLRQLIRFHSDGDLVHILDQYLYALLRTRLQRDTGTELDQESTALISSYLAGGAYHMIRTWLTEEIRKSPAEIAELTYDLLNHDLEIYTSRKGQER